MNKESKDEVVFEPVKEKAHYVSRKGNEVLLENVIDKKDIYKKNGITIITLVGLQKIAEYEQIVEKDFRVEIMPSVSNKQQTVVNVWLGYIQPIEDPITRVKFKDDKDEWVRGSGEASELNTGELVSTPKGIIYKERNKVDSCYRFAMAEKRAFSRALLKMIKLYGVHGEVEAQDFAKTGNDETDLDL